jgi:murein DD-endopeptidase MepM/ murein hydrolase activator NlpD
MLDKKKYQEMLLDEYGTLDKKLKKLGLTDIKTYLSSINSENITEEEKEKKILAQEKKWFGGLRDSERVFLLELYLHSKGRLRQNTLNGTVSKFHETIIQLVSIIMQSHLRIKKEITIHPNVRLLQSLTFIFPRIDAYRESLKLQDYYLANSNIELLTLEMQKEEKINTEIDEYLIRLIQQYNDKITDFKQSFISKIIPRGDSGYLLKTGIITLLMVCVMYTSATATSTGGGLNKNPKNATEMSVSFSPVFPMSTDHRITALFGYRNINKGSKNHKGIDIGCQNGTPIYAIEGGTIEVRNQGRKGYGLYVVITHPNGVQSLYGHGSKIPSNIKDGTVVNKGDLVMYSGSSGTSTGGHLHFEIIVDGARVDPLPFYSGMLSTLTLKTETIPRAQKDAYQKYLTLRGE